MKKLFLVFLSILFIVGFASSIQAIPNLGVGPTNGGFYRGEYQDWLPAWDVTFIPDTRSSGFYFPTDGSVTVWFGANNLRQWTDIEDADLFLFSTQLEWGGDPISGELGPQESIQIDGYKSPDGTFEGSYYVWDLPDISEGGWDKYNDSMPWIGDESVATSVYGNNKQYWFYEIEFPDGAILEPEQWLFLVADLGRDFIDGDKSSGNWNWIGPVGGSGGDNDFLFSPKTTSMVPEPSSMILLGFGLIGLAGFRRKFKK